MLHSSPTLARVFLLHHLASLLSRLFPFSNEMQVLLPVTSSDTMTIGTTRNSTTFVLRGKDRPPPTKKQIAAKNTRVRLSNLYGVNSSDSFPRGVRRRKRPLTSSSVSRGHSGPLRNGANRSAQDGRNACESFFDSSPYLLTHLLSHSLTHSFTISLTYLLTYYLFLQCACFLSCFFIVCFMLLLMHSLPQ